MMELSHMVFTLSFSLCLCICLHDDQSSLKSSFSPPSFFTSFLSSHSRRVLFASFPPPPSNKKSGFGLPSSYDSSRNPKTKKMDDYDDDGDDFSIVLQAQGPFKTPDINRNLFIPSILLAHHDHVHPTPTKSHMVGILRRARSF
jgi:hypothetical protein